MSGEVIKKSTPCDLAWVKVVVLVDDMEHYNCIGVSGARYDETDTKFVERYFLIIGERALEDHEDVLACIDDPRNAGKHLMLYKKPVSPRTVEWLLRESDREG